MPKIKIVEDIWSTGGAATHFKKMTEIKDPIGTKFLSHRNFRFSMETLVYRYRTGTILKKRYSPHAFKKRYGALGIFNTKGNTGIVTDIGTSTRISTLIYISDCRSSALVDTNCCGLACDSQGMWENGVHNSKCGCFKNDTLSGDAVIRLALRVMCIGENNTGHSFNVKNLTSHQITAMFISGSIPPGISASMVTQNNYLQNSLRVNGREYCNVVNCNGGFIGEGWMKKES